MNRFDRRALERKVRKGKVSTAKRINSEPGEAPQTILMGAIELGTFKTEEGVVVAVQVRNVGGHCVVGLTPDDLTGLQDAIKLVLEDVEVADFVAEVESQTGGPVKVVG